MSKRLFHYTTGNAIYSIVRDGIIDLETDGDVPFKEQRPAVWCTYSQKWEETCNKGILLPGRPRKPLSRKETERQAKGLYRIELDEGSAPFTWDEWIHKSGVSRRMANGLLNDANSKGSDIGLWRVSFSPIKIIRWISIERWNKYNKQWVQDPILMLALQGKTNV